MNLTKILVLDHREVRQSGIKEWENYYLAHHFIPFRTDRGKLNLDLDKIGENIRKMIQEEMKKLRKSNRPYASAYRDMEEIITQKLKKPIPIQRIKTMYIGIRQFVKHPLVINNFLHKINIIYAPNGFGKSTILEGLFSTIATVENRMSRSHVNLPHLWNVYYPEVKGVFGFTAEDQSWIVTHQPDQIQRTGQAEHRLSVAALTSFAYSNILEKVDIQSSLDLLVEMMIYFDLKHIFIEAVKGHPSIELKQFKKCLVHLKELKQNQLREIYSHKEKLLDLLNTLISALTSNSWLNTFQFDLVPKGKKQFLVLRPRNGSDQIFKVEEVLNWSEQKMVRLAIHFLFYFLVGYKYSKVVILDDFFESLDRRQYYNLLRFTITFSHLLDDTQWLIFTYRESIARSFYYEQLIHIDHTGYFNLLKQPNVTQEGLPLGTYPTSEGLQRLFTELGEDAPASFRVINPISNRSS